MTLVHFFTVAIATVSVAVQVDHQTESKQQLLAELDTFKRMCHVKDQQILRLKDELMTKQDKKTSLSDQFEQRESEMQEQKGIDYLKMECT